MIDTLKLARRLEASGIAKAQADELALAINDAVQGQAVSKADLVALGGELRGEITRLQERMRWQQWQLCLVLALQLLTLGKLFLVH